MVTIDGETVDAEGVRLKLRHDPQEHEIGTAPSEYIEEFAATTSSGSYDFIFRSPRDNPGAWVSIDAVDFAALGHHPAFTRIDFADDSVQFAEFDENRNARVDFDGSSVGAVGLVVEIPEEWPTRSDAQAWPRSSVTYFIDERGDRIYYFDLPVWTSNIDGELGRGETVRRKLSAGMHTIIATATLDTLGVTWTASDTGRVEIRPATKPVASIQSPADGSQFAPGETIDFRGTVTDVDLLLVGWDSSLDGSLGRDLSFSRSDLSVGTHTIRLIAVDSLQDRDTASVTITVGGANTPPAAAITSPSDGAQFAVGTSIAFAGTATDAEDGDLTDGALAWTSNLDGEIGTGTSFTRSDLSAGTHAITLTATDFDGFTGTASVDITVTPPTTGACTDFELRLDAASDTIAVVPGQAGVAGVLVVNRAPGFTGAVALMLTTGAGGDQPNDVLYQHAFDPNPVPFLNGDGEYSTLSFTAHLNDLSVGETFDIDVAGASPNHEAVPPEDWCRLPVTFVVVGS